MEGERRENISLFVLYRRLIGRRFEDPVTKKGMRLLHQRGGQKLC